MKVAAIFIISVFSLFTLNTAGQVYAGDQPSGYKGPPAPADAVIYETDVRFFSRESNLSGVTAGLDGIKALGANVIYLMPIYPIGEVKSVGSPYGVRDYTSVNKKMGTMNDLRTLVQTAHQKNIAVILDLVANHTSFDNPWLANQDWYLRDNAGNAISPPGKGWNDAAQLNYKNMAMRAAMIKVMQYWVLNADIDGFRCDYADGPPIDFWKDAIAATRKVARRNLLFLAESGTRALYKAGFDIISGFDFYNYLKQVYKQNKSVAVIDDFEKTDEQNTPRGKAQARYISNHDVVGLDGPIAKAFNTDRGAMAAFVLACMQGPPIIYSSQEGIPEKIKGVFAANYTPEQINPDYKTILAIRSSSNAIKRGRLTTFSTNDLSVFRKDYGAESVLIICNLRNREVQYMPPAALAKLRWTNAVTKQAQDISNIISLEPYGYLILKAVAR